MGKARFTVIKITVIGALFLSSCTSGHGVAEPEGFELGILTKPGCRSLYFDATERKAQVDEGSLVRNTAGKIVAVTLNHKGIDPESLIVSVFGIQQRAVQLTRDGLLRLLEPADSDAEIDVAYCVSATTASL